MDILTFWLALSIGAAIGWFIGVLMTGTKVRELEDDNLYLKRKINTLEEKLQGLEVPKPTKVRKKDVPLPEYTDDEQF
jgi:hypothetical protein